MDATVDLLINARWIIQVEPADTLLEHHSVAIRGGQIVDILPQELAREKYCATQTRTLAEHILIPGLVNAHTHAAMNLLRGFANDLPLMAWLNDAIWPAENKLVSPAFVRDGSLLAGAEMLRGGITTCNDMYFFPDAAAEAFEQLGMRAVIGMMIFDFPSTYAVGVDEYFQKGLEARDRWKGNPRIGFSFAPHAPYTVSDNTFERIVSLAGELDSTIHIHIHETTDEVVEGVEKYGMRPLARLERLGLLGPDVIGVHAVHLSDEDIERLDRHRCATVHCPTSNMKLACGISPVMCLLEKGLNVGLGTDGAASNGRIDLFQEMRHAALLGKVATLDATAVSARQALEMATLGGAKALHLDKKIGSIAIGKQADLCAVAVNDSNVLPCFDPWAHLVYTAGREHVSDVWIDGEARVVQGELLLQPNDIDLLNLSGIWYNRLAS